MARIERSSTVFPVTMTSNPATSQVIPYGAAAGGVFVCTAGGGDIYWHVTHKHGVTPVPLIDKNGNQVVSVVGAGTACELPSALFAAQFIVGVCDAEGFLCVSG
jgi:hypothetical protein